MSDVVGVDEFSGMTEEDVALTLFDIEYYRRQCLEVGVEVDEGLAVAHYLSVGWKEGLDPCYEFSTHFYCAQNPGVYESGDHPFIHYIKWGRHEGRPGKPNLPAVPNDLGLIAPASALSEDAATLVLQSVQSGSDDLSEQREIISEEFDTVFYLEQSPDLQGIPIDPLYHYLTAGWREHRDPNAEFSTQFYLETNLDVKESGVNPFVHFIEWGRAEGRRCNDAIRIADERFAQRAVSESSDHEKETVAKEFDPAFYLSHSPDLIGSGWDPLDHYMTSGWRELRDPSENFSTAYYLENYSDIRDSGVNPFYHYIAFGRKEGRNCESFSRRIEKRPFQPLVSAIVPNYNHARFLRERVASIIGQDYSKIEVIILDDCSTDESLSVIQSLVDNYPERIRAYPNVENSGNVFSQWQKGISLASGDFIWICESDDFCEPTFLSHCLRNLADPSVMIAFGRIQFADEAGNITEGLDQYREQAEPGIWDRVVTRSACQWFRGSFAVSNLIANVGGCVFRKQAISQSTWVRALQYKILGDWYLYAVLARGGRVSYCPTAVAYFRQHGKNTSVASFLKPHYYKEHEMFGVDIRSLWGTPDDVSARFYGVLFRQFRYARAEKLIGKLSSYYSNDRVMGVHQERAHILICFLGFHLGGGELFPIHLANELVRTEFLVSVVCLDTTRENPYVATMLDKRIAVYDVDLVNEVGADEFVERNGIDIIHSHNIGVEFLFFKRHRLQKKIPYVVTLHGSYEVTPLAEDLLLRVLRSVSHWVYLSPKNLEHLEGIPLSGDRVSFVPNGMPDDHREFPFSRTQLGVEDGDLLFTLASRAIKDKGWRIAINALRIAQEGVSCSLHLMLCGTGPEADELSEEMSNTPRVHFMGFQENINGAYRISDAALLPTRFPGESYPLTLIQALQSGCPIVATDIGEIPQMLRDGQSDAGILIQNDSDDITFTNSLARALVKISEGRVREKLAETAQRCGKKYSISNVAEVYTDIFSKYVGFTRTQA